MRFCVCQGFSVSLFSVLFFGKKNNNDDDDDDDDETQRKEVYFIYVHLYKGLLRTEYLMGKMTELRRRSSASFSGVKSRKVTSRGPRLVSSSLSLIYYVLYYIASLHRFLLSRLSLDGLLSIFFPSLLLLLLLLFD